MPTVFLPSALRPLAGGAASVEIEGATVGEVVTALEERFPELGERIFKGGALRSNLAIAVDGAVTTLGLLEKVEPESEIHFVAAISGGAREEGFELPSGPPGA